MRSFVPKTLLAMAIKAGAVVAAFLFNVILSRELNAAGAGQYFLALNVAMLATVLARIGLDNVVLRVVADSQAKGESAVLMAQSNGAFRLVAMGALATTVAVWLGGDFLAVALFDSPDVAASIRLMSLSILPASLLALLAQAHLGREHLITGMSLQSFMVPVVGCALLPLMFAWLGKTGAAATYVASTSLSLLAGLVLWFGRLEKPETPTAPNYADLVRPGLALFWVAVMDVVMISIGSLSLGIFATDSEVGVFNIAYRVATITSLGLVAANAVVAPRIAALHAQGRRDELQAFVAKANLVVTAITVPAALVFLSVPNVVLAIFGSEFSAQGATALRILTAGHFVSVAAGSVGYLLMMCGHERSMRNVLIASAGTSLVLHVVLVPSYGVLGAAIGSGLTMAAMNLTLIAIVYRKVGVLSVYVPGFAHGPKL